LVLKGILIAIWGASLVMAVRRRGIPTAIAIAATALTMILAISYADFRPNFITLVFIALELYLLYNVEKKYYLLWLAVLLIIIWANMHGGFIIGIIILLLWGMSYLAKGLFNKKAIELNAVIQYSASAVLAIAGAGLVNPYGMKNLTYFFIVTNSTWKNSTTEWAPVWTWQSYGDVTGFLFFVILILFVICLRVLLTRKKPVLKEFISSFRNSEKIDFIIFETASSIILIIMAVFSRRFIPSALILLTFILARQILWLSDLKLFKAVLPLILLITLSYSLYNLVYIDQFMYYRDSAKKWPGESLFEKMHMSERGFPVNLVKFLNTNKISGNMLCEWTWEGFIKWNCPDMKFFIGGRDFAVYDEETFNEYDDIFGNSLSSESIVKIFNARSVQMISISRNPDNAIVFSSLAGRNNWLVLYADPGYVLMVNENYPAMADLVKRGLNGSLIFDDKGIEKISRENFMHSYNSAHKK
jgi:hypothetical protein